MSSYKENLQHFEGPTLEQDTHYARLSEEQRNSYDTYVNRVNRAYAEAVRNGIPKDYMESQKVMNEVFRANVDVPINMEELYALDAGYTRTIWDVNMYAKMGVPVSPMANPRWQSKGYRLTALEQPRATKEFNNPRFLRLSQADGFSDGFGLYLGITMSWQAIKESGGGLWDPLAVLNQQGAEKFGLMQSRVGFRGYDSFGLKGDDGSTPSMISATGLLNHASAQTFHGGIGSDEVLTDTGDVHATLKNALALFDKLYTPHKTILVTSRGVVEECLLQANRDTYAQKLDMHRIKETYFDTGMIDGWMATDHCVNGAATLPAVAEQQLYLVAIGTGCQHDVLPYPLQKLTLNDKKYANDYREVMIWGRIMEYKQADTTNNVFPLAAVWGACTTEFTGAYIPQGWVDLNKYLSGTGATGLPSK